MQLGTYYRSKTDGTIWKVTATEYHYNHALGQDATHITLTSKAGEMRGFMFRLVPTDTEWSNLERIDI